MNVAVIGLGAARLQDSTAAASPNWGRFLEPIWSYNSSISFHNVLFIVWKVPPHLFLFTIRLLSFISHVRLVFNYK